MVPRLRTDKCREDETAQQQGGEGRGGRHSRGWSQHTSSWKARRACLRGRGPVCRLQDRVALPPASGLGFFLARVRGAGASPVCAGVCACMMGFSVGSHRHLRHPLATTTTPATFPRRPPPPFRPLCLALPLPPSCSDADVKSGGVRTRVCVCVSVWVMYLRTYVFVCVHVLVFSRKQVSLRLKQCLSPLTLPQPRHSFPLPPSTTTTASDGAASPRPPPHPTLTVSRCVHVHAKRPYAGCGGELASSAHRVEGRSADIRSDGVVVWYYGAISGATLRPPLASKPRISSAVTAAAHRRPLARLAVRHARAGPRRKRERPCTHRARSDRAAGRLGGGGLALPTRSPQAPTTPIHL